MFRFTIRDLLWLMVVVGMGVGWWLERTSLNRKLNKEVGWRSDALNEANAETLQLRLKIYELTGQLPVNQGYNPATGPYMNVGPVEPTASRAAP